MQIIQIADLHISESMDLKLIQARISKLYDAMQPKMSKDEELLICLLGDIVDRGDSSVYAIATYVIRFLVDIFVEFSPVIAFAPGNHDLCSCPYIPNIPDVCTEQKCALEHFVNFAKEFDTSCDYNESIIHKEFCDIDIILANSVFHSNCKYGLLDTEELEHIELNRPALLVTHHTFLSEGDNDTSAIRNAYKVFDIIGRKNIVGIFHGHTHGYKDINIGDKCPVIGVGPFLKEVPNVNNQANLVIATSSGIHKVINYYYSGDLDRFDERVLYARNSVIYSGMDIGSVYKQIVTDTKKLDVLPNMQLNLKMPYNEFNTQVECIFSEDIQVAELWQKTDKVPDSLYYNHGDYMKVEKETAIGFIVEELLSKATSSRAIIPLINFKDVLKSGDGFLPSFDLVQFGFLSEAKTTLIVTVYLRALEVNHFLKINICEIYVLCKQIAKEIRSITDINVNLLAFRAQYKEKFGCFRKAEIDLISESKLLMMIQKNAEDIVPLLVEKKDYSETVIQDKGIHNLSRALNTIHEETPVKETILEIIEKITKTMEELKCERQKTSNYATIEAIETDLNTRFDEMISAIEGGDIYES